MRFWIYSAIVQVFSSNNNRKIEMAVQKRESLLARLSKCTENIENFRNKIHASTYVIISEINKWRTSLSFSSGLQKNEFIYKYKGIDYQSKVYC